MYLMLMDRGEKRLVTDEGFIGRPSHGVKPSAGWQAIALIRRNNFGHGVERIAFADWARTQVPGFQWFRNNGAPLWHVVDLDHGTTRIEGEGVQRLYVGHVEGGRFIADY